MLDTLTIEELKTLISLNRERLKGLHPDTRRAQVAHHNLEHACDELDKRLREACMAPSS